ncbi:MAG: Mur ligase domain-containing protein, partial [Flavobacteriaceae bacterium]
MTIEALHQLFLKLRKIATDTRKIEENSIFFALRGANFNGNAFAREALEKGAAYV